MDSLRGTNRGFRSACLRESGGMALRVGFSSFLDFLGRGVAHLRAPGERASAASPGSKGLGFRV